jgi:hypothetical protein
VASNLWSLGAYAVPGWSMRGGWRLNRSTGPERSRKIALGYSDDLLLKQTAVMDLNMRAASAGMMILRHLLQPFLLEPLPVTLSENLVTYNMKSLETARSKDENCDICRSNPCAVMAIAVKQLGFPLKWRLLSSRMRSPICNPGSSKNVHSRSGQTPNN